MRGMDVTSIGQSFFTSVREPTSENYHLKFVI